MADGDISRRLVAQIRDQLGDVISRMIPNDEIIYQRLDAFQKEWMGRFKTTLYDQKLTFLSDTTTYAYSDRFFRIIDIMMESEDLDAWDGDLECIFHNRTNNIIFTTDYPVGVDFYVVGYIKPSYYITTADPPVTVDDTISDSVDPIISDEPNSLFLYYLKEAVLSGYRSKNPDFRKLSDIEVSVRKHAIEVRRNGKIRLTAGNNLMSIMFF